MPRPDWRVAGAAGLLAGLSIGGFSLVSASPPATTVAPIELRRSDPSLPPAASPGVTVPAPSISPVPSDSAVSPESPEVVVPPVISERATPGRTLRPVPVPVVDSDSDSASVASAGSSD
jgi:hypothetical protein